MKKKQVGALLCVYCALEFNGSYTKFSKELVPYETTTGQFRSDRVRFWVKVRKGAGHTYPQPEDIGPLTHYLNSIGYLRTDYLDMPSEFFLELLRYRFHDLKGDIDKLVKDIRRTIKGHENKENVTEDKIVELLAAEELSDDDILQLYEYFHEINLLASIDTSNMEEFVAQKAVVQESEIDHAIEKDEESKPLVVRAPAHTQEAETSQLIMPELSSEIPDMHAVRIQTLQALEQHTSGNYSIFAELLGVSPKTVHSWLLSINKPPEKQRLPSPENFIKIWEILYPDVEETPPFTNEDYAAILIPELKKLVSLENKLDIAKAIGASIQTMQMWFDGDQVPSKQNVRAVYEFLKAQATETAQESEPVEISESTPQEDETPTDEVARNKKRQKKKEPKVKKQLIRGKIPWHKIKEKFSVREICLLLVFHLESSATLTMETLASQLRQSESLIRKIFHSLKDETTNELFSNTIERLVTYLCREGVILFIENELQSMYDITDYTPAYETFIPQKRKKTPKEDNDNSAILNEILATVKNLQLTPQQSEPANKILSGNFNLLLHNSEISQDELELLNEQIKTVTTNLKVLLGLVDMKQYREVNKQLSPSVHELFATLQLFAKTFDTKRMLELIWQQIDSDTDLSRIGTTQNKRRSK